MVQLHFTNIGDLIEPQKISVDWIGRVMVGFVLIFFSVIKSFLVNREAFRCTSENPLLLKIKSQIYPHKKSSSIKRSFLFVQAERLELSHLAALDPKSSVSTNSTTPAFPISNWDANIMQIFNSLNFQSFKNVLFCIFKLHPKFALCKTYKITFQKTNKGS